MRPGTLRRAAVTQIAAAAEGGRFVRSGIDYPLVIQHSY